MRDGKFLKQMEERTISLPVINEATVPVSVSRLEKFIETEVRLDILKKRLEIDPEYDFIDKSEIRRILGMEVLKSE